MLIPTEIPTADPAPVERRSTRKPIVLDDRWMLYAFPLVWFAVLLVIAALIWGFQYFAMPFFSH
ncbi:MAG: hypothetical protein NTW61_10345 [Candidatus Melainabacteria bacterium]|nr:hypothetical protein [Candidatus Melainabacteria bacterium]